LISTSFSEDVAHVNATLTNYLGFTRRSTCFAVHFGEASKTSPERARRLAAELFGHRGAADDGSGASRVWINPSRWQTAHGSGAILRAHLDNAARFAAAAQEQQGGDGGGADGGGGAAGGDGGGAADGNRASSQREWKDARAGQSARHPVRVAQATVPSSSTPRARGDDDDGNGRRRRRT
jgi:hypothetical protein